MFTYLHNLHIGYWICLAIRRRKWDIGIWDIGIWDIGIWDIGALSHFPPLWEMASRHVLKIDMQITDSLLGDTSKVSLYKQSKPPLVGEHAFPLMGFVCRSAHVAFGGSGGIMSTARSELPYPYICNSQTKSRDKTSQRSEVTCEGAESQIKIENDVMELCLLIYIIYILDIGYAWL